MRVPMPALLLVTSLLVTGGAVGSASAHAPAAPGHAAAVHVGLAAGHAALAAAPWSGAPGQAAALPAAVAALAAALIMVRGRRGRPAFVVALALLLALLAFETGLHSVHHLAEPGRPCVVATASAHVAGTVLEAVTVDVPCAPTGMSALLLAPSPPASRPPAPALGRAPPA